MPAPTFSVIIPSYKMGMFIGAALDSVGAQTCADWEVIVVEDCGPEDGTEKIVKDFAAKHPQHRVEFIRHKKNTGVSGARNTAMAASTGDLLAFLDPDDGWVPDYLAQMERMLADADICASGALRIDENGEPLGSYIYGPTAERIAAFPGSLGKSNFFNPSFTIIRRKVHGKLGGFDEAPEIQHAEDWDYWLRGLAAGFRFRFTGEEWCLYREHPGAATSNHMRMSRVCAECLRRNIPRFGGELKAILKNSLYQELLILARLQFKDRQAGWFKPLFEAIGLFPLRLKAWKRILRLAFSTGSASNVAN